jgi:hypothetical protein
VKRLFQIGLLGGAVALTVVWWGGRRPHEVAIARIVRTNTVRPGAWQLTRPALHRADEAAPATAWATIESKDPVRFIANLRAIGCPEQTIRDIITFSFCRDYWSRFRDLETEAARSRDYTRNGNATDWAERRSQQNDLRNAMDAELEAVLGVNADKLKTTVFGWPWDADHRDYLRVETQREVRELDERYRRLTEEARQGAPYYAADPAIDAKVHELNRQKQAELAQILTLQELETLNLHESEAARYVRSHLPEAKSEDEFRKMVNAVAQVGMETPKVNPMSQYGLPGGPDTSEQDRATAAKQAELDARLRQVLGEGRVAEQAQEEQARQAEEQKRQQEQDEKQEFVSLTAMAESLGLSAEDTRRFHDRLKESLPALQKKLEEMSKTHDGSQASGDAIQATYRSELERIATETLGDKGLELVKRMTEKGR